MMPLFIIDIMRMERVTQWSTQLLFVGHWVIRGIYIASSNHLDAVALGWVESVVVRSRAPG